MQSEAEQEPLEMVLKNGVWQVPKQRPVLRFIAKVIPPLAVLAIGFGAAHLINGTIHENDFAAKLMRTIVRAVCWLPAAGYSGEVAGKVGMFEAWDALPKPKYHFDHNKGWFVRD